MDCTAALEGVRSKLEGTFGKALALMIVAAASNAIGCPTVGLTSEQFVRLAEAIAADDRVVSMWGAAGAADALADWKRAVA